MSLALMFHRMKIMLKWTVVLKCFSTLLALAALNWSVILYVGGWGKAFNETK